MHWTSRAGLSLALVVALLAAPAAAAERTQRCAGALASACDPTAIVPEDVDLPPVGLPGVLLPWWIDEPGDAPLPEGGAFSAACAALPRSFQAPAGVLDRALGSLGAGEGSLGLSGALRELGEVRASCEDALA